MLIATTCPNCKALFRLPDDMAGQKVKCQKCQHVFVVPKSSDNTMAPGLSVSKPPLDMEIDPPPPQAAKVPMVTAAPPSARDDASKGRVRSDDEPSRPSSKKTSPSFDKKMDRRPMRRERSTSESSGGGAGWTIVIVLFVGVGLFTCLGCSAGIGWWVYDSNQKKTPIAKVEKKKTDVVKEEEKGKVDFKNKPDDPPPPNVQFPPGGINVVVPANATYRDNNALTQFDILDGVKRKKIYTVHMVEGTTYQIDLASDAFDSYLYLFDSTNQLLAQDDDGGGYPDARIVFRAPRTGFYRIHATHFGGGQRIGNYSLFVRRSVNGELIKPPFP